ncbi:hypothetical protein Y1Q_0012098 [Alligator mississippiensis]|uniref:Uncharacterized protein n=1 Tax=Alligator mississippiensis TaxID=8496 RepID=A0A151P5S8_ALLMI|nr:hypothetical protein Y1Q_0012098 [Alligator mississippiensis]
MTSKATILRQTFGSLVTMANVQLGRKHVQESSCKLRGEKSVKLSAFLQITHTCKPDFPKTLKDNSN